MTRVANRTLIGQADCAVANDAPQARQALLKRQFEQRPAILVEEIESEERHRRIAKQGLAHFPPAKPRLDYGERQNAIAECDDLPVENERVPDLQRRRFDFRESMSHVVERARVDPDLLPVAVDLG